MSAHLNKVKGLYDSSCTSTGKPADDQEIINTVADGIGAEYQSFIDSLHVRERTTLTQSYQLAL